MDTPPPAEQTHLIDAAADPSHEPVVTPPATRPIPQLNSVVLKWVMGGIFFLWAFTLVAVDVFAWLAGASATLSQSWLALNRCFWPATFILAFLEGILIRHVSLPGAPAAGHIPGWEFFLWGGVWTLFFWVGMYVTYRHLWQLNSLD